MNGDVLPVTVNEMAPLAAPHAELVTVVANTGGCVVVNVDEKAAVQPFDEVMVRV